MCLFSVFSAFSVVMIFRDSTMSLFFPNADELSRHTIFPGVHIQTCAADKMMLSVVDLAPYAVVEEHAHLHEQVGMILQGQAIFFIGGEQKTLQVGDLYRIPGNVRHKVIALDEPVRALDIFHPIREEYR
jgi:quercetin dioxygenase-like cupin family protein